MDKFSPPQIAEPAGRPLSEQAKRWRVTPVQAFSPDGDLGHLWAMGGDGTTLEDGSRQWVATPLGVMVADPL